jgi:hypothetical protein
VTSFSNAIRQIAIFACDYKPAAMLEAILWMSDGLNINTGHTSQFFFGPKHIIYIYMSSIFLICFPDRKLKYTAVKFKTRHLPTLGSTVTFLKPVTNNTLHIISTICRFLYSLYTKISNLYCVPGVHCTDYS